MNCIDVLFFELHYFWSEALSGALASLATGTVAKQGRRREAEPRENEARTGMGRIEFIAYNTHIHGYGYLIQSIYILIVSPNHDQ